MKYFGNFNLSIEVQQSIKNMKIVHPTPIQEKSIPLILKGKDVVGIGQTGTGKTLAFGSCMISMFEKDNKLKGLILAPTRELVIQIEKELERLTVCAPMRIVSCFGGSAIESQIHAINKGVDILVATPGRLMDLYRRKVVKFDDIKTVVIDEADEMLKMGFIEEVDEILGKIPTDYQMLLFSATMKDPIKRLLAKYMQSDYEFIQIDEKITTAKTVDQFYIEVKSKDKLEVLTRLIDAYRIDKGLIFCLTKKSVDELADSLKKKGYLVEAIHGDYSQETRLTALRKFEKGKVKLLVATDVMARGIDISGISHVINYEVGKENDSYVHRIGRTGRASESGVAISLVTNKEKYYLENIAKATNTYIKVMEIPTATNIKKAVMDEILKEASKIAEGKKHQDFMSQMKEYDHKTLMMLSASLMKMLYDHRIGYDESVDFENKNEYVKLRINAGSQDHISYTNIMKAVQAKKVIPTNKIGKIQVERKYSIIEVSKDYADLFIKTMNRVKILRVYLKIDKMGD